MGAHQDVPGLVRLARIPAHERQDLLAAVSATLASASDPLAAVSGLRRQYPDWDPDLCSAVVAQCELIASGTKRGLIPPDSRILATAVGLEQASRPEVSARRARMLATTGVRSVVDASAGIGMDTCAFVEAGLEVAAIELDPVTAQVCAANVALVSDSVEVTVGDATEPDLLIQIASSLPEPVAVFVDPARRSGARPTDGSRARPERDPERWSPPWSFVESLLERFEVVSAKAPGSFTPANQWSCEWIGVADYVAECAVYSRTPDAFQSDRQATLLLDASSTTLPTDPVSGSPDPNPPTGPLGRFLGEPHPVFHRALDALCAQGARRIHADSRWITSDDDGALQIPGVRWYRVLEVSPIKQIQDKARAYGIDALAIKCKESRRPISAIRSLIGLPDGDRYCVVLTSGRSDAILVERIT